jgi:hypothetical protein
MSGGGVRIRSLVAIRVKRRLKNRQRCLRTQGMMRFQPGVGENRQKVKKKMALMISKLVKKLKGSQLGDSLIRRQAILFKNPLVKMMNLEDLMMLRLCLRINKNMKRRKRMMVLKISVKANPVR